MLEVKGFFGLLLLIADVWAIVHIVQSDKGTGGKVLWIVGVVLFPLLGFIVWLLLGPKSAERRS